MKRKVEKNEKTSWHFEKYMVLCISFRKQIIQKICKKKAKNKLKKVLDKQLSIRYTKQAVEQNNNEPW